jgi:hypothetical protein
VAQGGPGGADSFGKGELRSPIYISLSAGQKERKVRTSRTLPLSSGGLDTVTIKLTPVVGKASDTALL